ncbi:molybdopterin-guanine dinucleotide biosynthesis protein MobB, partial [Parapusillimonas sp. SGNA-6]|nr:molybdopterin-guanine dinucleotide biosynthesis protein MobB [Parapusillimonas sp. SGNA-6]
FAMSVMDEYARNFKRPGIDSHRDLLWFGKLENYRYYSHNDREVKSGQKRKGERKEGRQMHVQIIVSRKDITNKIKLSPQNTSRGKNKAHSQKLGQFDRTAFKQSGETLFDELFDFERNLKDSLQYANMMKNGTAQQKAQMHTLTELTERHPQGQPLAMELAHDVAQGMFESVGDMLTTTGSMAADLWELLMAPVEGAGEQQSPIEEEEKRRKRKKKAQSRGIRR